MIEHLPSSLARHRQWRLEGIRPDGYGLGQVCQAGDSRHAEVTRIMHLKTSETIQKTDGLKQALKVHTGVGRKRSSVRPRGQDDQTRPWLSMSHQRAFEPRCVHGRLYVAPFTATGAGAGAGAGRVNQCQHAVPRDLRISRCPTSPQPTGAYRAPLKLGRGEGAGLSIQTTPPLRPPLERLYPCRRRGRLWCQLTTDDGGRSWVPPLARGRGASDITRGSRRPLRGAPCVSAPL